MKPTASIIENRVANHFDYRRNIIVPNVSWGFGLNYECDMVILRPSGYLVEVEIKVDKYDLRNDIKKSKWRYCKNGTLFKQRYFAVPVELKNEVENIPDGCGFLSVDWESKYYWRSVKVVKPAKVFKKARKIDEEKKIQLMRLGLMRIWSLKNRLNRMKGKQV